MRKSYEEDYDEEGLEDYFNESDSGVLAKLPWCIKKEIIQRIAITGVVFLFLIIFGIAFSDSDVGLIVMFLISGVLILIIVLSLRYCFVIVDRCRKGLLFGISGVCLDYDCERISQRRISHGRHTTYINPFTYVQLEDSYTGEVKEFIIEAIRRLNVGSKYIFYFDCRVGTYKDIQGDPIKGYRELGEAQLSGFERVWERGIDKVSQLPFIGADLADGAVIASEDRWQEKYQVAEVFGVNLDN